MIGNDVEIIIVDVRGDKVRLGITAPRSIPVHRREIYDLIKREETDKKKSEKKPEDQPQTQSEEQTKPKKMEIDPPGSSLV